MAGATAFNAISFMLGDDGLDGVSRASVNDDMITVGNEIEGKSHVLELKVSGIVVKSKVD